jgi:hypothetical protein
MVVAAEQKVASFSALVNGGSYDRLWADADELLREQLTKEQFLASLAEIRATLGSSVRRTLVAYQFDDRKGPDGGRFLSMQYDTTFSSGPAQELFVWRVTPSNLVTLIQYRAARVAPSPSLRG